MYGPCNRGVVILAKIHVVSLYIEFDVGYMICKQNNSEYSTSTVLIYYICHFNLVFTKMLPPSEKETHPQPNSPMPSAASQWVGDTFTAKLA